MGKFRKHFHALVGALVLCLSLTTAIAETYPGYTTQNLNVRVASGGEGKIVAHLDTDEDVLVIGEEQAKGKGWLLVEVEKNGETVQGYVLKSGVERAVQMQMYSGIYSLTSLRTGEWKNAQTGETGAAPQDETATVEYEGYGVYSGAFSGGKRSGDGTFLWENGENYVGEWKSDQIFGKGILDTARRNGSERHIQKGEALYRKYHHSANGWQHTDENTLGRETAHVWDADVAGWNDD
ncbi:MAG: hypothetical protein ACLR4A_01320 [Christensenellales bacterium]